MEKIIISSDSTSDLGPALLERYNIPTIPLGITLGDKTYLDCIEINADDVYEYNTKTGQLPKTTATNISQCEEFFKKLTADGSSVIHFSLSNEFSSTYNNARIAAEDFPNVYVIDSRNLSSGIGLLMLYAEDLIKEGFSAKEIFEKVTEKTQYVDASFVIDSLEYLYKGGRCSALSVLGANLLKLKPCIEVKNGVMGVGKKYRGKFESVLPIYAKERLADLDDIDTRRIFVTNAGCDKSICDSIVDYIKSLNVFEEVFTSRAGCTISSHCGRNTLGVLFIRKSPIK